MKTSRPILTWPAELADPHSVAGRLTQSLRDATGAPDPAAGSRASRPDLDAWWEPKETSPSKGAESGPSPDEPPAWRRTGTVVASNGDVNGETHRTANGELVVELVADRLMATRIRGAFEAALVGPFVRSFDRWAMQMGDSLYAFHDWQDMTAYDADARIELTHWTLRHRAKFTAIHFLLRSKLVALGVQTANIALGGFMKVHTERRDFDESLTAARREQLRLAGEAHRAQR